jgi:hypothetical protein
VARFASGEIRHQAERVAELSAVLIYAVAARGVILHEGLHALHVRAGLLLRRRPEVGLL